MPGAGVRTGAATPYPCGMGTRVFEYRDWVKQTPVRPAEEVRRLMIMGYVMTGVLALLCVISLVVILRMQPLQLQLIAGVFVLGGAAVLMFRKADTHRRSLALAASGSTVSPQGEYPLSISDTSVHFPQSLDAPKETWPLEGTTAELNMIARQQIVVLRHKDRKTRHFFANAMADPVGDVLEELERRSGAAGPDVPAQPQDEAESTADEGGDR